MTENDSASSDPQPGKFACDGFLEFFGLDGSVWKIQKPSVQGAVDD
jgi:hypothetical protein